MEAEDVIGEILWYGILATPLIGYIIARQEKKLSIGEKIILAVAVTVFLSMVLYMVAMGIVTRDGLGPT
jgi:cell division protein FtsL